MSNSWDIFLTRYAISPFTSIDKGKAVAMWTTWNNIIGPFKIEGNLNPARFGLDLRNVRIGRGSTINWPVRPPDSATCYFLPRDIFKQNAKDTHRY